MARLLGTIPEIKGMKQIEDPTVTLPPGYCQLISNYYKSDGVWFQRTGATKVLGSATGNPIMGIREVLWDDASKSILVASGDKWYTDSGTGLTTLTSIQSQLLNNQRFNVKQFKISGVSNAIIASAAAPVKKYNKSTVSNLTSIVDFSTESAKTLATGENLVKDFVIDSTNTYMYVACYTTPAKIVKIQLSDMSIVATKTLATGENLALSLAINSTDTYLYIGCNTSPGKIVKLTLSDFTTTTSKDFGTDQNGADNLIIDSTGTYLYASCGNGDGIVAKLTLADFTTLATKEIYASSLLYGMVIDHAGNFIYASDNSNPTVITKLTLADFTTTATKTLGTGERNALSIVIDSTDTYLYIGCNYAPIKVVKLTLSDFTTTATIAISNSIEDMAIDSSDTYLHTVSNASPSVITKITLSDFTTTATKTLATGENLAGVIKTNTSDTFLFIGCYLSPAKIVSLALNLKPKFVEIHKSKCWLGGFDNDVYRYMEYFSKTLDATDYTTANDAGTLTFATELSTYDTSMGKKSWGDYIAFFFKNTILVYFAGTNPNDFRIVKKIENIGSLTGDVILVGTDLWFPTINGIMSLRTSAYNGEIVFNTITQDIDPFWSAKITAYGTNTDRISMKYDKIRNQIMVLANDSSNQGVCFYVYSVSDKVWSTYNILGLGAAVSITAFEITQDGLIYFGTSDGNIYQLFSGSTDNGTAISYKIRFTTQYFGSTNLYKKVKYIRIGVQNAVTAGSIAYEVDQKGVARNTTTVVIPSPGDRGMAYGPLIPVRNRGKSWDFEFTNMGLVREVSFFGEIEGEK